MKKAPGLDVLRGLAALLIVVHHAGPDVLPGMAEAHGALGFALWKIRHLGWTGIDLFFVLGGFFMCDAVFSDLERVGTVRLGRYWKRRGARIIPSYYVLLLVLGITGATGYVDASQFFTAVRDVLTHVLFLQNYVDQVPNGPTWFLGAMVHFYILIPLLCAGLSRRSSDTLGSRFTCIAATAIAIPLALRVLRVWTGTHMPNDFMVTHFRVDAVFIGMLAMHMHRVGHPAVAWLRRHARIGLVGSALLVAPALFLARKDPYMFTVGFTLLACGYAGLILLISGGTLRLTARGFGVLAAIATCSYNVYLWHYFLPALMGRSYASLQHAIEGLPGPAAVAILAQVLFYVLLSIAWGYLATILIERPATRLLSGRRRVRATG
jgi:peptidoglycan/LPS O-acetylase OafA/YrhL